MSGLIQLTHPRVCLVSDIHIGVHQNAQLWHNIALDWAKWLDSQLKEQGIRDIVICGDLFHYRDEIAVNTIHVVTQILKVWSDYNIVMLVGNHDAYYKDRSDINSLSILSGWPNITVVSSITKADLFGKQAVFCPWGTSLSEIGPCNIIFGHFEIESFKLNKFKVCDHGFRSSDLLKKSRLIISGHFHHREEREYSNGKIVYLGNPFQMDFGDVDSSKGYHIMDFSDLSYKFIENNLSPKHYKMRLSEMLEQKSIDKEKIEGNFVKFYVDKQITTDDIDALLSTLFKLKPISLNVDYSMAFKHGVEDDSSYDFSGVDISTAIQEFINLMDIDNKEEVSKHTLELYRKYR